jgi:hypothetical protein
VAAIALSPQVAARKQKARQLKARLLELGYRAKGRYSGDLSWLKTRIATIEEQQLQQPAVPAELPIGRRSQEATVVPSSAADDGNRSQNAATRVAIRDDAGVNASAGVSDGDAAPTSDAAAHQFAALTNGLVPAGNAIPGENNVSVPHSSPGQLRPPGTLFA